MTRDAGQWVLPAQGVREAAVKLLAGAAVIAPGFGASASELTRWLLIGCGVSTHEPLLGRLSALTTWQLTGTQRAPKVEARVFL